METSLIIITMVSGFLSQIIKNVSKKYMHDDISALIPMISFMLGTIITMICFYSGILYVGDTSQEALISGILAGSGMTGLHQIPKQITKYYKNISSDPSDVESMNSLLDNFKIVITGIISYFKADQSTINEDQSDNKDESTEDSETDDK